MARWALALIMARALACGEAQRTVSSASATVATPAPSPGPSTSAPSDYTMTMSPEIQGIFKEARECKVEHDNFVDCEANIRWSMANRALLLGPADDALIFEMVFDADQRVRLLGVERPYMNDSPIFKDARSLERLVARIAVEPNRLVRASLAFMVGEMDASVPGFVDAAQKVAHNQEASLRSSLARGLAVNPAPAKADILKELGNDADRSVQREASLGASAHAYQARPLPAQTSH